MQELIDLIKSAYSKSINVDLSLLPNYARDILENYLIPLNPSVPKSSLLLSLNVCLSHILCFNRVKILIDREKTTYPNVYGITFMPSGSGKDKPIKEINVLLEKINNDIEQMIFADYEKRLDEVKREAEMECKSETQKNKYIKENKPRKMGTVFRNATAEGLTSQRYVIFKSNFGSLSLRISEFIDFILSDNNQRSDMLSDMIDIFDHGNSEPKFIKSEKEFFEIRDVPQTMLVHSSISGLIEDRKGNSKLLNFFNRGSGRRSLNCFPDIDDMARKFDINRDYAGLRAKAAENEIRLKNYLYEIFLIFQYYEAKKIKLEITEKAMKVWDLFNLLNEEESLKIDPEQFEGVRSEIKGRGWKAIKLAGVIACYEHPKQLEITEDDMLMAIYQVTLYSNHLFRFYSIDTKNECEKLFEIIFKNQGITKTKLRTYPIIKKANEKDKTRYLNDLLTQVKELCDERNLIFKTEKIGNNKTGRQYFIEEAPRHKEPQDKIIVNYSIGDSMNVNVVKFNPQECDFFNFGKVVNGDKAYSATAFKNNYRKQVNVIGNENIAIFDIDNDDTDEDNQLTIEKVKLKIENRFICLISPTKSHNKQKGEKPPRQRFRIIFPLAEKLPKDKEKRYEALNIIARYFGIKKYCGDKEMQDNARYYFPAGTESWVNKSGKLLSWKLLESTKVHIPIEENLKKNAVGNILIKDNKGNNRNFLDFNYLTLGQKESVHCPFHEDKNPSAFITRSNDSGNLYLNCSSCNETWWIE